MTDFAIEPLAEDAVLLRFGDAMDLDTNERVHAAARALRAQHLAGIIDIAPAYATLLVRFDPFTWLDKKRIDRLPHEHLAEILHALFPASGAKALDPGPGSSPWQALRRDDEQKADCSPSGSTRVIEIPVCYGGECSPDLDAVAEHAGLSREDVIARHTAVEYTVAMLGFAPGFPYLLGLDPALQVPRRTNPRTRVPAGSVAIGGAQTGIYPRELPGGWQLIGRTPLALFDVERDPPALLAPGDRVSFRAIDADEFARLTDHPA